MTGVSCACQVERVTVREETFPSFSIVCLLSTPQEGYVIRELGEGLLRDSPPPFPAVQPTERIFRRKSTLKSDCV